MKMMQWKQLLSSARLGREGSLNPEAQRSAFQRDYDRIIFSSAFRRMQDKTQVFPLAESDYVRTRLTHSLEAACVGRSLGTMVGMSIVEEHGLGLIHASDVGAIVAAACLAHDIGNPPFGHSGEDAIRHWFKTSPVARELACHLSPEERADFERFEGNAQGFRIVTRLNMPDSRGGLQLTCATLGAFSKYPVASSVPVSGELASTKKFSFFYSELELFAEVAERTGLLPMGDRRWCRHPLAFIVEAADDICYRIVDFEDGVRQGLIRYEEAREMFLEIINDPREDERLKRMERDKERIKYLRARAIGAVVEAAGEVFLKNEEALLAGCFEQPLIDHTPMAGTLRKIQERSQQRIYNNTRSVEIEAAGFEVISGLLDLFVEAVEDVARADERKPSSRSRILLQLVPEQFLGRDGRPARNLYTRLQRITDFVSGMTDSYAVGLYKKLRGISLPGQ